MKEEEQVFILNLKNPFRFRNSMLQVTKTVSHFIEYLKGS